MKWLDIIFDGTERQEQLRTALRNTIATEYAIVVGAST